MRTFFFSSLFISFIVSTGCSLSTLPQVAIDHNARGAELLAEGRLDEAEARFRLALEYRSNFVEPRANLGLVALARRDYPRAERELREAVRLNEDFGLGWVGLGALHEAQHQDALAIDDYREALSIDPGIVVARRNLVFALARVGKPQEARAEALRLMAIVEDDAELIAVLAWCELRMNRLSDAAAHVEAAFAVSREVPRAWFVQAALAMRERRYRAALEGFARAEDDAELAQLSLAHGALCALAIDDRAAAIARLRRLGALGARMLAAVEERALPERNDEENGEIAMLFEDVLARVHSW